MVLSYFIFLQFLLTLKTNAQIVSMCKVQYDDVAVGTFEGCTITWNNGNDHPYPFKIGYVNFPPYIFTNANGQPDGILKSMFQNYIGKVCQSYSRSYNFVQVSESRTPKLISACRSDGCHFSLVGVASSFASTLSGAEIAKFHSVPGIAFVTLAYDLEGRILDGLSRTIENVWPLFLVSMMCGFLAGIVVWMLERWRNEEDFPKPFVNGAYESFWWSYISMTTVGYGDKTPRSILGRLFSVVWILIGIALIGLITSMLSTSLTEATSSPLRTMTGLKVGCIDISPIAKTIILDRGGEPRCYTDIVLLERDMALGYVHGIAMDTLELQYYTKIRFKALGTRFYVFQETYTVTQMYVLGHFAIKNGASSSSFMSADQFQKCSIAFSDHNSEDQKIMELAFKEQYQDILDNSIFTDDGSARGVVVLDPDSPGVQEMMWYIALVVLIVIVIGLAFDLFIHFRRKRLQKSNKGYDRPEGELERNIQTREEKFISDAIERTMSSTEEKIEVTQKSIRNEIQDLAREIRQEMRRSRIEPVFDRDRPPTYHKFPLPPQSNKSFVQNNNMNNNLQNKPPKNYGTKNLAYQY